MSSSREWPQRERATRRRERWGAVVSGRSAVVSGVCAVVSVRRVVVSVTRRGMTAGGEAASVDSGAVVSVRRVVVSVTAARQHQSTQAAEGAASGHIPKYPWRAVDARAYGATPPGAHVHLSWSPSHASAHHDAPWRTRPQRAPAAMAPTHQTTRQRQGDREVQAVSGEVSALLTSVSGASGSAVSPHRI